MENRFSRNHHNRHQDNEYRCVFSWSLIMQALINQIFVTYNPGVTSDQNFFVHSNNND